MMKLTVLGEYGPFPAPGGACSGYLLQSGGTNILMDCGPGVMARLMRYVQPKELSAIVLTHLHFDHMSDLLAMRYALEITGRREKLPVYLPDEPVSVRALLDGGPYELHPIENFEMGGMAFSFGPAVHPVPGYSVRVREGGKTLLYTGDTNWHDELIPFAAGSDVILADAALTTQMWSERAPHLSAQLCGQLAEASGAKEVILTHLRPDVDSQAVLSQARAVYPGAVLARAGMVIELT